MFNGKKKAITFSYDDGVTQDIRLIKLFDKYGVKGTFNLNSELLGRQGYLIRKGVKVNHTKVNADEVKDIYKNHEVAAHTLTHPNLTQLTDKEIIHQIEKDRINLERLTGKKISGLAYPGGGINFNTHVAQVIKSATNIKYARTTIITDSFNRQRNLYTFKPNIYHIMDLERLFTIGKKFLDTQTDTEQILYIWGHSYEFDIHNTWEEFEKFLLLVSGKDDIFYGTNKEVLLTDEWQGRG